jgi:hypothetical protein
MADVLKVNTFARLKLLRNGSDFLDHVFRETDVDYTLQASDRVVLDAAMGSPEEANLGSLGAGTPATHLMLVTDREIKVALDVNTRLWAVSGVLMIIGSFSHLYLKNEDASVQATVEYLASDG